jgi:hypothetical protein
MKEGGDIRSNNRLDFVEIGSVNAFVKGHKELATINSRADKGADRAFTAQFGMGLSDIFAGPL